MKENLLDVYSNYLIIQNQYATDTGLPAMLDKSINHNNLSC